MSETIFYGGTIITMTHENPEAVFVQDGIIKAMGGREDIFALAGIGTTHINLKGKCLMPAFIDGHSHLTKLADSLRYANLSRCESFEEIITALKNHQEENNLLEEQWIIGFSYDHSSLAEKSHPNKNILDEHFPNNPVVISHVSGHLGVANTKALEIAKIEDSSPNPAGGLIGRDGEGNITGYLEENAFFMVANFMPKLTIEETLSLIKQAQEIYLSNGITTVQDGMLNEDSFEMLKIAAKNKVLFCDIIGYADMKNAPNLLRDNPDYSVYKNNLKLLGYKIFLDGSPQGRTAWMTEPYLKQNENDDENYRGYSIYTDDEVKNFVNIALSENKQLLAHCNGDMAAKQFVKAYKNYTDTRPVIIHAQFLPKDILPGVKEKGIIPSYFVAHTYYWGDTHIANMGIERAENISPAKTTGKFSIPFTFHQDTPVIAPDMLETIWCAVNRITKNGVKLGEEECISPYEALKAVTVNGAYQYFEENEKGSIETGKKADLIILSENPLETPKSEIKNIKVLETYKNGESVYKRRPLDLSSC